jgi:endoglucanase
VDSFSRTSLSALLAVTALACAACAADDLDDTTYQGAHRASSGRFAGRGLYVEPDSDAAVQAEEMRSYDPDGAAIMDKVADTPLALWIGDWMPDVRHAVDAAVVRAGADLQVFVVYSIPQRDCGSFSGGGASSPEDYEAFIGEVAQGLGGREAIVILEPDGLGLVHCLDEAGRQARYDLIGRAVDALTAAGAAVYVDAGHSGWVPAEEMAARLLAAGVVRGAGFALNVAHTERTSDETAYADELRALLGEDVHYVVDTSRNGLGPAPDGQWCNPPGRAHGHSPTLDPDRPGLDALLWIKRPGESDGLCNGGPEPGDWWPEYALGLARNAGY